MAATAEDLIEVIEPYRIDMVLAVECIFTWYWIADLCNREGIPFVLGHALYMKAIHGGKVKNGRSTPRFLNTTRWPCTCFAASPESERSLLW